MLWEGLPTGILYAPIVVLLTLPYRHIFLLKISMIGGGGGGRRAKKKEKVQEGLLTLTISCIAKQYFWNRSEFKKKKKKPAEIWTHNPRFLICLHNAELNAASCVLCYEIYPSSLHIEKSVHTMHKLVIQFVQAVHALINWFLQLAHCEINSHSLSAVKSI